MRIASKVERKTAYGYSGVGVNTKRRDTMRVIIVGIAFLGLAAISGLVPVHAQDENALYPIPEIKSENGVLKGVITLADEERMLPLPTRAC